MPVEFVGGLFPRNQLAPRQAYGAPLDLTYLRDLARAHEHAGFDHVLIASGGREYGYVYMAERTEISPERQTLSTVLRVMTQPSPILTSSTS